MKNFTLDSKSIGDTDPCFIIAEVAQAHDGSLGAAHSYIDIAAKAGADAVKFQTHIAKSESTIREPWRVKFSTQDKTRYDYWKRMEFTEEQWVGLKKHAEERDLVFLSSPFSFDAMELLERIGVVAWKVASGEIDNIPLLKKLTDTGLPTILSSGVSGFKNLDAAINIFGSRKTPFAVLQCTTSYPTEPECVGLNVMKQFKTRYNCPVGLSDHSAKIFPGLAAISSGANLLEVHITISRDSFGPDVVASLVPRELELLVEGRNFIHRMNMSPVDKDKLAKDLLPVSKIFSKSIVAAAFIKAGKRIESADIALKKPGDGIPAKNLESIVGRIAARDLESDSAIQYSDLI